MKRIALICFVFFIAALLFSYGYRFWGQAKSYSQEKEMVKSSRETPQYKFGKRALQKDSLIDRRAIQKDETQ